MNSKIQQKYTKKFNSQLQLSQTIAQKFGYPVSKQPFISQQDHIRNKPSSNSVILNIQINPLKIQQKLIQKTSKHLQLIKQIDDYQFRKKMLALQKKRNRKNLNNDNKINSAGNNNEDLNISKIINEKITQYNYLIDHKHLNHKNNQDTKKVLKLKPTTKAQKILAQIKIQKKNLLVMCDLNQQFMLNKKINDLYRQYKETMNDDFMHNNTSASNTQRNSGNTGRSQSLRNSLKFKQNKVPKAKHSLTQKTGRSTTTYKINKPTINNSDSVQKDIQCKALKNSKYTQKAPNNLQNNNNNLVQGIYLTKNALKKYQQQKNVQNFNNQLVKLYQTKYTVSKQNYYQIHSKFLQKKSSKNKQPLSSTKFRSQSLIRSNQQKQINFQQQQFTALSNITTDNVISQQQKQRNQQYKKYLLQTAQKKRQTNQKFFSTYLGKRNRKYKKPWGNKILIKYDSQYEARQLLNGQKKKQHLFSQQQPTSLTLYDHKFGSNKTNYSQKYTNYPDNISQQNKWVMQSMQQEDNDQKFNQIMGKNQKINLYLKKIKGSR